MKLFLFDERTVKVIKYLLIKQVNTYVTSGQSELLSSPNLEIWIA
jgi:hypothetical protein